MALESFEVLDTFREIRVIERKYVKGQKKLFDFQVMEVRVVESFL